MLRIFLTTVLVWVAVASTAGAQHGVADRDPFQQPGDPPVPAVKKRPPAADNNSWGRDPFSNPLVSGKPLPEQDQQAAVPDDMTAPPVGPGRVLTGIIYSKQTRIAIIGGELFREGSTIETSKLVAVRERSVVFATPEGKKQEVFLENFSLGKQ